MRNVALLVAYEGTAYHGFQAQPYNLPTIQGELEKAIQRLTGEQRRITGAGRTDAGVHAIGQVVNFYTNARIPLDRWPYALNSVLPDDIVVKIAIAVPEQFHARFAAQSKTYRYTLDLQRFPNVFWRRFAYHVGPKLNIAAMQEAANHLLGEHDFSAFQATGSNTITARRTLSALGITQENHLLHIFASANGFLYNMVRSIVGTLLEVGKGKRDPSWVAHVLVEKQRCLAGPTVPPQGLCLDKVVYDEDINASIGQAILDIPCGLH